MISVIVSVYEQARTLEVLLASLRRQNCSCPFEVLICDDGSASDMLTLVRAASGAGHLDVRYVWQPDQGYRLSRSRNNAIRCATGDILVFLDGDIIVPPDFLDLHLNAQTGDRCIVCGIRKWVVFDESRAAEDTSELLSRLLSAPDSRDEHEWQRSWAHSRYPWMAMIGGNFSVPRGPEVVFDEGFLGWGPEDRELACRLAIRHGYHVSFADTIQGVHLYGENHRATLNPLATGGPDGLVQFIRNKLYLASLYPDADIEPALQSLLQCFLDERTDSWYVAEPVENRRLDEVIPAARSWMERHGISYR